MRNPPASITAMPITTHSLADLESAFNARRVALVETVRSATLVGRVLHMLRSAPVTAGATPSQPTMANPSAPGYRSQPRGLDGKLLGKAWLLRAESFTAADVAWFRSPVGA